MPQQRGGQRMHIKSDVAAEDGPSTALLKFMEAHVTGGWKSQCRSPHLTGASRLRGSERMARDPGAGQVPRSVGRAEAHASPLSLTGARLAQVC